MMDSMRESDLRVLVARIDEQLKAIKEEIGDIKALLLTQNGRIMDLEHKSWKFDGTVAGISRVVGVILMALAVGVGIAKLFL